MNTRYFIKLSFKGTNYFGWQKQPNQVSVQGTIENRLSLLLKEPVEVTGAGRTDTGVHAKEYFAHFDINNGSLHNDASFIYKINRFLPNDISFIDVFKVKPGAHARFDAISRTYEYFISQKKDPFNLDFSLLRYDPLDIEKMNKAAALLLNYEEFTSFSKVNPDVKNHICQISEANWAYVNDMLKFTITANRFLRNMVRAITGTLIDVGAGKKNIQDFSDIIEARNRQSASMSASAKGLFLARIKYPEHIFMF